MSRKPLNNVKKGPNVTMEEALKEEPQDRLALEENRLFLQQLIEEWDARVDDMLDNLALLINGPWDGEERQPRACAGRG